MKTPPKKAHGLILTAASAGQLSPAQRKFNKLLGEVETLRTRIEKRTLSLELALKNYALHLASVEVEEDLARQKLMLKLGELWRERLLLKKGQHKQLRDLIIFQKDLLRPHSDTTEEGPLAELLKDILKDWKQEKGFDGLDTRTMEDLAETLFDPSFMDPSLLEAMDPTRFSADMSPGEILEEYKRQADRVRAERAETGKEEKQTRREEKAAKREAEMQEARNLTIGTLYKQLAKVLHPDMERDPKRQTEKLRLMQQVTEAYRNKDLFTLLRLEVEHLRRDEGDVAGLTEAKLRIYVDVLKEQVSLLNQEYESLEHQPRFSCMAIHVMQAYPRTPDWRSLAERSRNRLADMERSLDALNDKPAVARKELQELLTAFGAIRKLREQSDLADFL